MRDVFRLYDQRLALMLSEDDPQFANWDQDVTAVAERYGSQDPARVAGELEVAGRQIASSFSAVEGEQWSRRGRRSDGAVFTVESFARYFVHDPVHHLLRRGLSDRGGRPRAPPALGPRSAATCAPDR